MNETTGKPAIYSMGITGPFGAMVANALIYAGIIPVGDYDAAAMVFASIVGGIIGIVGRWRANKKITSVV